MWIYTKFVTLRNGKRIYAHHYGLKAFRIWVKDPDQKKQSV